MTDEQREALKSLCERYHVEFNEDDYTPQFDLPDGYVAGWIGGLEHSSRMFVEALGEWRDKPRSAHWQDPKPTIYVGCDPEGRISS